MLSRLEDFLHTHYLQKCPECGDLVWVHFDCSGTCFKCTDRLYSIPNQPSYMVSAFVELVETTDDEYRRALKELILQTMRRVELVRDKIMEYEQTYVDRPKSIIIHPTDYARLIKELDIFSRECVSIDIPPKFMGLQIIVSMKQKENTVKVE